MLSKHDLAAWLLTQHVESLAILTGLSTKTIYRLRRNETEPSYKTLELLVNAGAKVPRRRKQAAPVEA